MRFQEAISKFRVWGFTGVVAFVHRALNESVQARRLRQCARRSRYSRPERGITVIGELTGQVSLSKTLRDFVLSLREAGIPCQTYDTCAQCEIPAEDAASIVTPAAEFDLKRYDHIVMMYRAPLDPKLVPGIKIGRIAFHESLHGIHETAPYLKASGDAIIAMSDFNYEYYKDAFKGQPVYKITYPLRLDMSRATPRNELRAKYGVGPKDFLVYFNFDFGSYYRKNIPAALKAFALAFKEVPDAKLLFKTKGARKNPRQVREMECLVDELKIRDQFLHISSYLPRTDVDGFAGACDVYLSLHKSEGFGLGMAEVMAQGRPVVATNWSANTEFCRPDTALCVPYRLVPILPHEYMPAMKEWAEADVDAAAQMLKECFVKRERVFPIARNGQTRLKEHFSIAHFEKDVNDFLGEGV